MEKNDAKTDRNDDALWEWVLNSLSAEGRLARFYKLPRHELKGIVRLHGRQSPGDLARLFAFAMKGERELGSRWIAMQPEARIHAILLLLGRSMKCWIETGNVDKSLPEGLRGRWTVARA